MPPADGLEMPSVRAQLREMPLRYQAWHAVPFLMPIGFLLIFLGARGAEDWLIPVGFALLGIVLIDTALVFPLVMVRAMARRSQRDSD